MMYAHVFSPPSWYMGLSWPAHVPTVRILSVRLSCYTFTYQGSMFALRFQRGL